jgi:single-stranded-DNA-specific exonuclease
VLRVEPYEPAAVAEIEQKLNLPHLIARILAIRGARTAHEASRFLYPKIEHLSDAFLLPDIKPGVAAVIDAVTSQKKIGVFGDYDADGITSTALMLNFFRKIGVAAEAWIPAREEGYGLNRKAVEGLAAKGVKLLICLDCGSSNIAEIEAANAAGMTVVVIDHHEVPNPYPAARALVNPKRSDARFPTRELAACGVVFFFLLALRRSMHEAGLLEHPVNLKRELDLVCVGTVADMVPLTGDNRILVKFGMEEMQNHPRRWLKSFYNRILSAQQKVDAYVLGFIIVPRINAAGRVSDPATALHFLTSSDKERSESLLAQLDEANRARRNQEENIVQEATEKIEEWGLSDRSSLVLYKDDWPIGVIGIAAQKLAESFGKPCIIFTRVDGTWKGSARGIPGLDLHGTVSTLSSLLLRFGGHKYACGLSILDENLSAFPDAFDDAVKSALIGTERSVTIDAMIEFDELSRELVEYIELLAPFGVGNPRPAFLFDPLSFSMSNRFVKLTDRKNRIWYGNLQKKVPMPRNAGRTKVIASPALKEEMGEKFIHFHIKEFVTE